VAKKQRKSYVQRQLDRELRRFLRTKWRVILSSVAMTVAVCVVPLSIGTPPYVTGLLHASMAMSLLGIVGLAFLLSGSAMHLLAGSYGEAYTQDALAVACTRGHIWHAVHNVELGGADIDSIILAPAGVLAIETKWRFGSPDDRWLDQAAAQADRNARKTRSVLRSKDIGEVHEVRAVLVVWGGGQRELGAVRDIGDVTLVPGDLLGNWLASLSTGRMAQDNAEALHCRLASFANSRVLV